MHQDKEAFSGIRTDSALPEFRRIRRRTKKPLAPKQNLPPSCAKRFDASAQIFMMPPLKKTDIPSCGAAVSDFPPGTRIIIIHFPAGFKNFIDRYIVHAQNIPAISVSARLAGKFMLYDFGISFKRPGSGRIGRP